MVQTSIKPHLVRKPKNFSAPGGVWPYKMATAKKRKKIDEK